jgi:hypothetical protein
MASEKTLAIRSQKQLEKAARRDSKRQFQQAVQDSNAKREQGQVAAQFITGLARDIYLQNVALWTGPVESAEDLYKYYEGTAHKSMDAAIAFVRASNSYDDRGQVAKDAPPILAEGTDANGSPVDEG